MVLMREQINRTEQSPERDPHLYSQVILRGAKAINEAKIVLSTNSAGIDFYTHTMNLDTELILFTKINLKWITYLNVNQNYKTPHWRKPVLKQQCRKH